MYPRDRRATAPTDRGSRVRGGASSCRPSRNLQERYGASRNTIRDAIKQLITLGLVETRPGQGTFVVPPIDPFVTTLTGDPTEGGGGGEGTSYASEVEKADRKPSVSKIKVEIQAASDEVAPPADTDRH